MSLFRRLMVVLGAGGAGYQSEYRKTANIFSAYNLCSSVPVEELTVTLTSSAVLSIAEVRLAATGLTSIYDIFTYLATVNIIASPTSVYSLSTAVT